MDLSLVLEDLNASESTEEAIPVGIEQQLKLCFKNIVFLRIKKSDLETALQLQTELGEIVNKIFDACETLPPRIENGLLIHQEKLDSYIRMKKVLEKESTGNDIMDLSSIHPSTSGHAIQPTYTRPNFMPHEPGYAEFNPKQLPNFDGKRSQWLPFKMIAEPALINSNLPPHAIIGYLMSKLSGRPLSLFQNDITSGVDIFTAWRNLSTEYEDKVKTFIELRAELRKISYVKNDLDLENLKTASEIVSSVAATLKNLSHEDTHSMHSMLEIVAERYYFQAKRHIQRNIQTVAHLADYCQQLYYEADRQSCYPQDRKQPDNRNVSYKKVAALNSPTACNFCGAQHSTKTCSSYPNPETLAQMIKAKGLCVKCLEAGHVSRECNENIRCEHCNRFHLSALHDAVNIMFRRPTTNIPIEAIQQTKQESPKTEVKQVAAIKSDRTKHFGEESQVGEIVFIVNNHQTAHSQPILCGQINQKNCELMIDYGAQISVIPSRLVPPNLSKKPCYAEISSPINPIPICVSSGKISVCIKKDTVVATIEAFVMEGSEDNVIIIGNDMVQKLIPHQPNKLQLDTIFGPVRFCTGTSGRNGRVAAIKWWDSDELENLVLPNTQLEVKRLDHGRFQARLPFLDDHRPKDNFFVAKRVMERMRNRLLKDGSFYQYETELMAYIKNKHAEKTTETSGFYLPHHPVVRDASSSTPLRVVFNGSFGLSNLNEFLWKGEARGLDVFEHLTNFRRGKTVALADLSKAFLQVEVHPDDRKFIRFLWINNLGDLSTYQMTVLPFGLACSPAILTAVVQELLEDNNLEKVAKSMYMDDLILADDDEKEILRLLGKAVVCFESAGFRLHKIRSNNSHVVRQLKGDPVDETKVLGIKWNLTTDNLAIQIPPLEHIDTRRKLLAYIGKSFDPLGFVDPWKLLLRKIFREISRMDWDETISKEYIDAIHHHCAEAETLNNLAVSRRIPTITTELYGFCDASQNALGYCIFSVSDEQMHFIMGKSKLAPQDNHTIVELELLALLELTKALIRLNQMLGSPQITIWSDSMINLQRLAMSPNTKKRRAAGALCRIIRNCRTMRATIRHVAGAINPADVFSRMVNVIELIELFPASLTTSKFDLSNENSFALFQSASVCSLIATNFSMDTEEATSIVARICSMKGEISTAKLNMSPTVVNEMLNLDNTTDMLKLVSQFVSDSGNNNEKWNLIYKVVQSKEDLANVKVPLCPLADDGVLRVATRQPGFNPIWIPQHSPLVDVLVKEHHEKMLHAGSRGTFASLSSEYFIQGLTRKVNAYIAKCVICARNKKKPIQQPFGQLPPTRTNLKPFDAVAIDIFGPLNYANGSKFWGLLLTCTACRLVKLEVLGSLSAADTLAALDLIFCSVGLPSTIYSDNGTSFVRAQKEISALIDNLKESAKVDTRPINWIFSPPGGPWFNGCAERLIGVVKRCLKVYSGTFRSAREIRRAFAHTEIIVNSRPLIQDEARWISPFEIYTGRPPHCLAQNLDVNHGAKDSKRLYQQLKVTRAKFEKLWKAQYVQSLALPSNLKETKLQPGQLVLVPDQLKKRADWPVASILEVSPSQDGIIRTVKIELDSAKLIRPANGLIPLPFRGGECDVTITHTA